MTNSLEPDFFITNPIDVLPKTTAAESEIYASSQLAQLAKTFKISFPSLQGIRGIDTRGPSIHLDKVFGELGRMRRKL